MLLRFTKLGHAAPSLNFNHREEVERVFVCPIIFVAMFKLPYIRRHGFFSLFTAAADRETQIAHWNYFLFLLLCVSSTQLRLRRIICHVLIYNVWLLCKIPIALHAITRHFSLRCNRIHSQASLCLLEVSALPLLFLRTFLRAKSSCVSKHIFYLY